MVETRETHARTSIYLLDYWEEIYIWKGKHMHLGREYIPGAGGET